MIVYGPDIETTGLSPYQNEIISIQYLPEGEELWFFPRWEYDSEAQLVLDFFEQWREITRKRSRDGGLFVGYNQLKFDIPFLYNTCLRLPDVLDQLAWTKEDLWKQLYRWPMYLDLSHLLGSDFIGMDAVRTVLTDSTAPFESKQVPVFYESERYDLIEAYVRDEMDALAEIYSQLHQTAFFAELMDLRRAAGYDRPLR